MSTPPSHTGLFANIDIIDHKIITEGKLYNQTILTYGW